MSDKNFFQRLFELPKVEDMDLTLEEYVKKHGTPSGSVEYEYPIIHSLHHLFTKKQRELDIKEAKKKENKDIQEMEARRLIQNMEERMQNSREESIRRNRIAEQETRLRRELEQQTSSQTNIEQDLGRRAGESNSQYYERLRIHRDSESPYDRSSRMDSVDEHRNILTRHVTQGGLPRWHVNEASSIPRRPGETQENYQRRLRTHRIFNHSNNRPNIRTTTMDASNITLTDIYDSTPLRTFQNGPFEGPTTVSVSYHDELSKKRRTEVENILCAYFENQLSEDSTTDFDDLTEVISKNVFKKMKQEELKRTLNKKAPSLPDI